MRGNWKRWFGTTMLAFAAMFVSAAGRPNILFFEVDDLLYRFTGRCGRGFVMTPRLDALAEKGVYFRNAVCQGMMCGPSRNSLITGLYPHNLGFYRNGQLGHLPKDVWSLPAALRRCGYETAWVGKCHVRPYREKGESISEAMRKQMGFDFAVASAGRAVLASQIRKGKDLSGDVYIEHLRRKGLLKLYIEDCMKRRPVTSLSEDDYLDGFYTKTALDWLDQYDGKKPFFLWINLSCPHGPHDVPQKYHDLYKNRKIPPPLSNSFGGPIPEGLLRDNRPADPAQLPELRRGYAAAVTFVDTMLGRVLDKLEEKGLADDTVVFFFSDQGIFMGNHGRLHKGTVFWEIMNPCLVVAWPKKFRKGAVEDRPVELLDLVKTALDLAGAPEAEKEKPFGESFLPLLEGKGPYSRRYAFAEIEGFPSVYDGHYHFIDAPGHPLLYDLRADPAEMKNLAADHPEVVERMRGAIKKWYEQTGAPRPPERRPVKKSKKRKKK